MMLPDGYIDTSFAQYLSNASFECPNLNKYVIICQSFGDYIYIYIYTRVGDVAQRAGPSLARLANWPQIKLSTSKAIS